MSAPKVKIIPETCTFAYFLESVPPGAERMVSDLLSSKPPISFPDPFLHWSLNTPDIQLHCSTETCRGVRVFRCLSGGEDFHGYRLKDVFLIYSCRNCTKASKTYALRVAAKEKGPDSVVKYGEMPAFGPPLPPRLINIFGDDRELFMKGRRTESQSLGIGAFVYYRRVVENQKDRLLEEIRKAAERLGADTDLLDSIDRAKGETQFSKAIELVKDAIPDGLKVQGENPLTLLHRVLSRGVHGLDDRECLERAQAVRQVLTELVSNIAQVTKDKRELTDAVKKLRSVK